MGADKAAAEVAADALEAATTEQVVASMGFANGDLSESMMQDIEAAVVAAASSEAPVPASVDEGLVSDLEEMGFNAKDARKALAENGGRFKDAVRMLVSDER